MYRFWHKISNGQIEKSNGLAKQFEILFEKFNIDFSPEIFNDEYQLRLADKIKFNDNANKILKSLSKMVKQYAVTDGTIQTQQKEIKTAKLTQIFDKIFISEQVGFSKPNKKFFDYVFKNIKMKDKEKILIVGDGLNTDIKGGLDVQIKTCWYNPKHIENKSSIKPDYEIDNLNKIYDVILSEPLFII